MHHQCDYSFKVRHSLTIAAVINYCCSTTRRMHLPSAQPSPLPDDYLKIHVDWRSGLPSSTSGSRAGLLCIERAIIYYCKFSIRLLSCLLSMSLPLAKN